MNEFMFDWNHFMILAIIILISKSWKVLNRDQLILPYDKAL